MTDLQTPNLSALRSQHDTYFLLTNEKQTYSKKSACPDRSVTFPGISCPLVMRFVSPRFPFSFPFHHPAMQSTLGTAGASRHPRGVLNGALAEQTPGPVPIVFISSFLRKGRKKQTGPGLTRTEGADFLNLGSLHLEIPRCHLAVKPAQENPSDMIVIVVL